MAKSRPQKEKEVTSFVDKVKSSKVTVFARFSGIPVKQEQELRAELRKSGNSYNAIKKTLLKLVFKSLDLNLEDMKDTTGSIAAAFSANDEVSAAKSLYTFAKAAKGFELLGGIYNGKLIPKSELEALAVLPSREELVAKLLYVISHPLRGLVSVMNGPARGLVQVLHAMQEKKS